MAEQIAAAKEPLPPGRKTKSMSQLRRMQKRREQRFAAASGVPPVASAALQLLPSGGGALFAGEGAALGPGKRQRSAGNVEQASLSKRPRPGTLAAEAAAKPRAEPAAQGTPAVNVSASEGGSRRPVEAAPGAAGKVVVKKRKARPALADAPTSALDRGVAEAGDSVAATARKKRKSGSGAAARASDVPEVAAAPDDSAGAGTAPVAPHKRKALAKAAGKARGAPICSGAAAGASEEAEASKAARKAQRARKAADRKAAAGGAGADALGGVPVDPERRAAWLARVAELAAARKPTDKPLPRPMRLALKQKLREDKRAAMVQRAKGHAKLSREAWERRRAAAQGIARAAPAAQLAWLAEHQAEGDRAGGPRMADLAEEAVVCVPDGRSLEERLAAAVPELLPDLGGVGAPLPPGAPAALLVAPGAMCAQELKRQLTGLAQGKPIFKAFAKHLKLEAQQQALAGEPFAMAAGTPHRLAVLCAAGALRMDRLRLLVLDMCLDAKQMSIMDLLDVRRDFFQLWAHVGPAVAAGRARVALLDSRAHPSPAPRAARDSKS